MPRGGIAGATGLPMRRIMPALLVIGCAMPEESFVVELTKGVHPKLGDLELIPDNDPDDGGTYQFTPSMGPEFGGVAITPTLWKAPVTVGNGVCIDFSQPVIYVRAAPVTSPHRNKWIFFIQGGGGMQTFDDMLAKWFSGAVHGEMSSRWAPPAIGPGGIFADDPSNPFADFNMVFIHKCSSDRYMGRKQSTVVVTRSDIAIHGVIPGMPFGVVRTLPSGSTIEYAFRGHDIVDGVIDTLATTTVEYDAGAGEVAMPSLAAAQTVFFIGHSGGSRGATMIVDAVAARIRGFSPSADVRLVMDAGFDPAPENLVNGSMYPATNYPTADPANGGDPLDTAGDSLAEWQTFWDVDGDATCLANEADDAVCGDVQHVLMNWVETPMFVRQDLADSKHNLGKDQNGDNVPDCWQTPWDTDPNDCYGDTADQANATLAQIEDLNLMRTQALTHTVLGTQLRASSGFFPACGEHDGAHTNVGFDGTLTGPNGIQRSYGDSLWLWYLFPNVPLRAVEVTPVTGVVNGCPP
jgi:hypothetical protein